MDHPTEPRNGRRLTLAATVETPAGPLLCYSAHLEVWFSKRCVCLSDFYYLILTKTMGPLLWYHAT